MHTVIIDNYDSYTYNLYQMMAVINKYPPTVIRNDDFQGSWKHALQAIEAKGKPIDNIVISPGPGSPEVPSDIGMCSEILQDTTLPILGVCLGHQALALVYGGTIEYAPEIMHGRISEIEVVQPSILFEHIPPHLKVVRYHSLIIPERPNGLQVLAQTVESPQVIMALKHQQKPHFGVQFHPESICSEYGYQLLQNFRDCTMKQSTSPCDFNHRLLPSPIKPKLSITSAVPTKYTCYVEQFPITKHITSKDIFHALYEDQNYSYWLDSSNHHHHQKNSRFSFMGDISGPLAERIQYHMLSSSLTIHSHCSTKTVTTHILEYIDTKLQDLKDYSVQSVDAMPVKLPFSFHTGFVGYLGYEALLKQKHLEMNELVALQEGYSKRSEKGLGVPDATFLLSDRTVVIDHDQQEIYLVALTESKDTNQLNMAKEWFQHSLLAIGNIVPSSDEKKDISTSKTPSLDIEDALLRNKDQYLENIKRIFHEIHEGETYEVCLTNQLIFDTVVANPLQYYEILRATNPAPFSAFFHCSDEFSLCCSSPERFVSMCSNRWVESKPIKGTRPRGKTESEDCALAKDLATCPKDKAENLMIVDLVRNDLGRICEVGSVHVPHLMKVESYANVHQLVSTIRGKAMSSISLVRFFESIFPGGSMTGAPKERTMKILRELEEFFPRGIYSGTFGYFSIDGSLDFNIIIRSLICTSKNCSLGAGGAVVHLSDALEEYDEMVLKTNKLRQALEDYLKTQ